MSVTEETVEHLPEGFDPETAAWAVALLTFGIGDVATTHVGLQLDGVEEEHPLSEKVLGVGGTEAMIGVKAVAFALAWVAYQRTPEEYRAGIPIGLALLGVYIVANNAAVLQEATVRA
ncbi:ORF 15 [Haloarcula hispanica virus SH1]|uniref:ORF 15 n=1 Tax=Haloarcula hispanica SH1 virus TaxID=326574 RepID=Q4KPH2_9VIRU|nr:ORF 15 [Haloarcula hispanica virus SH1]AAY24941.1 ORF 15 [Haloarcula hispanica virus SH1]